MEADLEAFLDRVRGLAAERAAPRTAAEQALISIDLVAEAARISPDPPLLSRRLAGRAIKRLIAILIRFYMVMVTGQVSELGHRVAWMGTALHEYVSDLERRVAELEARDAASRMGRG